MIFNNKVEQKLGLRYFSGGSQSGSGQQLSANKSTSSGSGASTSQSTSSPQLTPAQVLSIYGQALPSIAGVTTGAAQNTMAAPATQAAVNGGTQAVNAINLNGLSPGEANATERSLNQNNTATGNLGLLNPTNTISNAMNFGGAFNSKIPLLNSAVGAAAGASNAANTTTGTAASLFNPISTSGNAQVGQSTSNSAFGNTSNSAGLGSGANQSSGGNFGCFLTTACCKYKGLPDNCEELTILRKFRDEQVAPELVKEYYMIAPKIVEQIKNNNAVLDYVWNTIQACIEHIKSEDYGIAINRYKMMVTTLRNITHV